MASTITPTMKDFSAKEIEDESEFTTIQPDFESKVKMPRLLDGTIESKTELSDDETAFEMTTFIPELPIEISTTAKINHVARYDDDIPIISSPEIDLLVENYEYQDSFVEFEGNTEKTLVEESLPTKNPIESDYFYSQESNTELPHNEAETMILVHENLDLEPEITTTEPKLIKKDKKPRLLVGIHESSSEPMESDAFYTQESNTEVPHHEAETMTSVHENLNFKPETTIEPNLIKKDKKSRILDGIHKSSSALSDDKVSIDTISETTTLIPELMSEKINNVPRTLKANEEITKDKPKANRLIFTGPYFGPYLVPFIGSFFGLHYHTSKLNQSSKIPKQRVNNGSRLTDDEKNSVPQMGTLSAHYGPYFGIYYLPYYGWYYLLTHNTTEPDIELLPDDYLIDSNNKPSFASK